MTKIGLRKAWFQVHKWIGLILAVVIIPISITGSALVWHDQIDEWMHPARHSGYGAATLASTDYAEAARRALGEGERLSKVEIPHEPGEPVVASATRPGKGRPVRLMIYLDPADARLVEKVNSGEGAFQVMHVIHGSLMIPGAGRQIVGWIGVAMLISSLTGIWLWWPVTGSVRRGFRWKRQPNLDANLHHMLGFWISVPLFVLSLTGVWISFPQLFAGFDRAQQRSGPPGRAMPVEMASGEIANAIARAEAAGKGRATIITWPTDLKQLWAIDVRPARGAPVKVTVDTLARDAKVEPMRPPQPQTIARTMRQIHDGNGMPFIWQLIVFLGGLIPAILAVTGIIMWWRARGWRGALHERKRTAAGRSAG